MGERGQGARREHSREVVRQRMLHVREARDGLWDATASLETPMN